MTEPGEGGGTAGIVLAAGGSERFGSTKQLAELGGKPLLEYALEAMEESPLDDRIVVLGADADLVRETVPLHGARTVVCDRWAEGQSRSLAVGLAAAGVCDAAVIILGDQPGVSSHAIRRVIGQERKTSAAVRATYRGKPGHPVLLPRSIFPEVISLEGDSGARAILDRPGAEVVSVACDDLGTGLDIDTPEELESARHDRATKGEGARS